ncbi:hypothetical protein [Deinococcus fonticola]|uniref:hypothetical protein n=1 Tax=Deinococcus fonticola TaxID=2528713 RepID=UPI0010758152|nr:hypothetical protein [Deinococcus fonticola]
MTIGILMVVVGAVLQFWLGNRAFKRRNQSGLETFSSYGKAMGTQAGERIILVISRLLIFVGLVWVGSAWLVNRM